MIPGELFLLDHPIVINDGRDVIEIKVVNSGDRPIQVGSHYHFFAVNPSLEFERNKPHGLRLNISAGTTVHFEPGQSKQKVVYGFQNQVHGALDEAS